MHLYRQKKQKEESKHQPRDQNDKNKNETTGSDAYTLIACCKRTSIDGGIPLSPRPATDHPAEASGGILLSPCPATATGGTPFLPLSRRSYWRYPFSPPISPLLLAVPLSPSLLVSLSRHWHWRFKLPASVNGGTYLRNRHLP